MHFVFVVSITEVERGWGQRPDGYFLFETEEHAKAFIAADDATRAAIVPNVYCDYTLEGYKPTYKELLEEVKATEKTWIRSISELTSSDMK